MFTPSLFQSPRYWSITKSKTRWHRREIKCQTQRERTREAREIRKSQRSVFFRYFTDIFPWTQPHDSVYWDRWTLFSWIKFRLTEKIQENTLAVHTIPFLAHLSHSNRNEWRGRSCHLLMLRFNELQDWLGDFGNFFVCCGQFLQHGRSLSVCRRAGKHSREQDWINHYYNRVDLVP